VRAALAVGFLALTVGVAAAYTKPATGYEVSVYAGTPDAFWAGVGLATAVGLVVSLFARTATERVLGMVLGGGSYAAIVGLPLVRNYHYFGSSDGLTHLAWTRGIDAGGKDLLSMLYPGIHTFAIFVGKVTGFALTRSLLYVVFTFAVVFVVFVPLCAWALTGDLRTTAIALFSGFMLLPITNISTHLVPHTTSQTLLFLPVALYLLVRYLRSEREGTLAPTPAGAVLAVALAALVTYHPQQALNLLLMLAAICVVQLVWGRLLSRSTTAPRRVYAQTAVFAVVWILWARGKERFQSGSTNAVEGILGAITGSGQIAADTAQRGGSLTEIGSGLVEIFLKIFAVTTAFSVLTAAVLLAALLRNGPDEDTVESTVYRYLTVAFVPVTGLFGLYMIGSVSTQAFRHLGFIVVLVTLVGSIGIGRGWRWLSGRLPEPAVGSVVTVLLAVAIVVSTLTMFASPWIYLPSQHVSEQSMSGYGTAFEHADVSEGIYSVRGGVDRFADAYYERKVSNAPYGSVNETAMATDLSAYHGTGWYFAITETDRKREVLAYDQLRYSRASFSLARSQRGVNRVVDNGGFRLYYVSG